MLRSNVSTNAHTSRTRWSSPTSRSRSTISNAGWRRSARFTRTSSIPRPPRAQSLESCADASLQAESPNGKNDRPVPCIRARQRRGMRACSPRSEFRTPDFDEDDRLAALCRELCHFEKLVGLLEAFDKTSNDLGIRIVQQVAGKVGKIEVCLVPCR